MLKKIACISIVILIVGALSLPCFAFEVPTYDEDTTQLVYYISGQDDLFYVKDKNSFFLYNPTDSVQTVRITLTDYFYYRSRFYIITSYSWINNNNCSIQYSSKFSDTTTYTFTDVIGGDYQSDFVSFIGTINPDGSDNVDFDTREIFCEISVNPGKVCAFQFAYNRIPSVDDDGAGADSAALMDETGLMAYTAVLYDISSGLYLTSDGSTPAGSEFAFFDIFNQIGQFTKLQGYNNGYGEGVTDGYTQASKFVGDNKYNDGYDKGFDEGYVSGQEQGYITGYLEGFNSVIPDPEDGSYDDGYKKGKEDGINAVGNAVKNNKSLTGLVPSIFKGIFEAPFDFIDKITLQNTAFGLSVSDLLFTFIALGVGAAIFSFIVSKVG